MISHTNIKNNQNDKETDLLKAGGPKDICVKVATLNAGGLRGKLDDVNAWIVEEGIDWLWVVETQWEEQIRHPANAEHPTAGRQERSGRAHHGTCILTNRERDLPPFELLRSEKGGNLKVWRWKAALYIVLVHPNSLLTL